MKPRKLPKGTYIVPDNCRAIVAGGLIEVRDKQTLGRKVAGERCRNCRYCKQLPVTAHTINFACELKPKTKVGDCGILTHGANAGKLCYYKVRDLRPACEDFLPKSETTKN